MLSKNQKPYDPDALSRSQRLRRSMQDLIARNELPASRVAEICGNIHAVAPAQLRDVGRVSKKSKHAARTLRRKFMKCSSWMPDYEAPIRCWNPKLSKIVYERLPMQLIHEVVSCLVRFGHLDKILATSHMDPLTKQHLEYCEAEAQCKLLGIGLWGDGAPTQWDRSQSIDVISMSLPGSTEFRSLRIPLLAIPHSRVCSETWEDIFAIVKWSLTILATGIWPSCRHDGTPWEKTDLHRKKPRELIKGALVEVRQDWKFAAETFGFPAHNSNWGCCWKCECKPDEVNISFETKTN